MRVDSIDIGGPVYNSIFTVLVLVYAISRYFAHLKLVSHNAQNPEYRAFTRLPRCGRI